MAQEGSCEVKCTLELDVDKCVNRFEPKYTSSQKWLDNEVLKDCDEYVPMRTGNLRKSGIRGTKIGSGKVIYNASYASSCYYSRRRFSKDKYPKATAQWFEHSKRVNKNKWINGAKKIVKGG